MTKTVLITGGAGFIGSHVTDELITQGHRVRVLDNLCSRTHDPHLERPRYLHPEAELIVGDVRDSQAVSRALSGVDQVCHLAAAAGGGHNMSDVETCTSVNNLGTAVLLQALIERPVERLVVASSKSIYGEGSYHTLLGQPAAPVERSSSQLKQKEWEVHDASGEPLVPVPTPETKPPSLSSVHALSKFDQERLCLMVGESYRLPCIALRFFNVYGPRQPLAYPRAGVLALFAARMLRGHNPLVFEDGAQRRDFIYVHDAARACCSALDSGPTITGAFNIGSGQPYTVLEAADALAEELGRDLAPQVTGRYRSGDVRHCFADIQAASRAFDFVSEVSFRQGIRELVAWLQYEAATSEELQRDSYPELDRELSA